MRNQLLFIVLIKEFIIFLFLTIPSFTHLCHDPYRPQKYLTLVPERELITIEEIGEFRMYVENTFDSPLEDIQLFVENPAFEIKIEPSVLKRLVPGERSYFLIKLKLREGFTPGDYPLRISVRAREGELIPTTERIDVTVEEKITEPKGDPVPIPQIKPEEMNQEEIPPEEKQVLPVPERKLEVPIEKIKPQEKERKPQQKVEEVPHQVRKEPHVLPERKLEVPLEEINPQEEEIKPQQEIEEVPSEVGKVVVRVEKIPFWKKPYFYIILISLLLGILIWRKIKSKGR